MEDLPSEIVGNLESFCLLGDVVEMDVKNGMKMTGGW